MPNGKGVLMVAVRGEGSWAVSSFAIYSFTLESDVLIRCPISAAPDRTFLHSPTPATLATVLKPPHVPRICRSGTFRSRNTGTHRRAPRCPKT
jgi:hypothetical protein